MSLPTTTVRDGGEVGGWVWAARDCGPTPEPYYTTTKLCITGMLFTPKAFQGSEKSTVDLSFSLSYFSKEVEVRDKFPAHFLSPSVCLSVCLSVITECVLRCFLVVVFWNFVSPLATAPILPTTCTVLAGSEPSSTAPKAPLSARSRARDPRTPSTAPKAPLLARKASRALHI